jgi:hypothetical protein
VLVWPLFVVILVFISIQINSLIAEEKKELSLDKISSTALGIGSTLQLYDAGSTYTLGNISPNISSLIINSPIAIATTLFRPFLWEVRSVVMLISALESFAVLLLTLYVLVKTRFKIIQIVFSKSIVLFCSLFSLVFSVGVAISSGNFGTLVRYKLPAMPFYLIFLLLVYHYSTERRTTIVSRDVQRKLTIEPAIEDSIVFLAITCQ